MSDIRTSRSILDIWMEKVLSSSLQQLFPAGSVGSFKQSHPKTQGETLLDSIRESRTNHHHTVTDDGKVVLSPKKQERRRSVVDQVKEIIAEEDRQVAIEVRLHEESGGKLKRSSKSCSTRLTRHITNIPSIRFGHRRLG